MTALPTRIRALNACLALVVVLIWNCEGLAQDAQTAQLLGRAVDILDRGGCGSCHIIPGMAGADGTVGPDLSRLGAVAGKRRDGMSAVEYIRQSIVDPDAFVAPPARNDDRYETGVMPVQFAKTLSQDDLETLVEFLAALGVEEQPNDVTPRQTAVIKIERPVESVSQPFSAPPGAAPTDAQLTLGKLLFFDRRLSNNNSLSCSSCHQPDKAFADGEALSRGYPSLKLFRNTPSLLNVAYSPSLYWDGRMAGSDLASVVRDHLTEAHFMAADGRLLVERMKQVPEYIDLFQQAYGSEPLFGKILDAIAAYVRSLNTPPSSFDRFLAGQSDAVSVDAHAGWKLFQGKAGCVRCHAGTRFTDGGFHRLDVPSQDGWLDDPERLVGFRRFFRVLGTPGFKTLNEDVGRLVVRFDEQDRGQFRTPSLREVARTAPYMHNGNIGTLEEVIRFYNAGGGPEQRADLKPLGLTKVEQSQLVEFLKSLSTPPIAVKVPALPGYALLPLGRQATNTVAPDHEPTVSDQRQPRPVTPLGEPPFPLDNPITPDKVALGRLLYFDPRMSADAAVSCNTCHPANTGYTARTAVSVGGTGTSHWRNASTIYNVAFFDKFNWEGARGSIEEQNDGAWNGAVAGNLDVDLAEERLAQIPDYVRRFRDEFGTPEPTWNDALRAVAAYQRTIVSRNVPFDQFLRGQKDAISESAQRGQTLFIGKAGCIRCHDGPLLSDDRYHATGVPQHSGFLNSPLKQITFRFEQVANGVPRAVYESTRDDLGLYYVTKRAVDIGRFRTPSLRELVHTAPYMHNGVFESLQEVVAFYNQGGGETARQFEVLRPLNLSDAEQTDLVEFLRSLSGDVQADRPPELPPYGRHEVTK
jgi:cytochrome c peroxidase